MKNKHWHGYSKTTHFGLPALGLLEPEVIHTLKQKSTAQVALFTLTDHQLQSRECLVLMEEAEASNWSIAQLLGPAAQ